ncbi:unnamed protein product, partial [Brenthis ino]
MIAKAAATINLSGYVLFLYWKITIPIDARALFAPSRGAAHCTVHSAASPSLSRRRRPLFSNGRKSN